jgi:hypothetical protein
MTPEDNTVQKNLCGFVHLNASTSVDVAWAQADERGHLVRIARTEMILLSKLNDAGQVMNGEALETNSSASNTLQTLDALR